MTAKVEGKTVNVNSTVFPSAGEILTVVGPDRLEYAMRWLIMNEAFLNHEDTEDTIQ